MEKKRAIEMLKEIETIYGMDGIYNLIKKQYCCEGNAHQAISDYYHTKC